MVLLSLRAANHSRTAHATKYSGAIIARIKRLVLVESNEEAEEPSVGTFTCRALHVHMMVVEMQVNKSADVPRVTGSPTQPTLFGLCVVIVLCGGRVD